MIGTDAGFHRVRTPHLDIAVNGAGDLIAALFLFHVLDTGDPVRALSLAASGVWAVIAPTAMIGGGELAIVAAQDELVRPSRLFTPEAC